MEKRLFFLLNTAQRKTFNFADQHCEHALGVSMTQLAALMVIAKDAGCSQKTVARTLGLNKSAVTGLINRMVKNELLERKPSADDARVMRLFPTPTGIEKTLQAAPLIKAQTQLMTGGFSEQEMEVVYRFLNAQIERFQ